MYTILQLTTVIIMMKRKTYISFYIKKARKKLGLSQNDLAKRLKVSNSAISRYERGNRKPPQYIITKLKELLSIPEEESFVSAINTKTS